MLIFSTFQIKITTKKILCDRRDLSRSIFLDLVLVISRVWTRFSDSFLRFVQGSNQPTDHTFLMLDYRIGYRSKVTLERWPPNTMTSGFARGVPLHCAQLWLDCLGLIVCTGARPNYGPITGCLPKWSSSLTSLKQ
jgi:hypothetical protein